MPTATSEEGRELMVRFTCQRCKSKALYAYDDVMTGEHYGYLRNSALPQGWGKIGYSTIACSKCVQAFKEFMNAGQVE